MTDLSGPASPADWTPDSARLALDDLFTYAHQYRSSKAYLALLQFASRFRSYAPYNALLLHLQKPGAIYVAPPKRWLRDYRRRVKANATPLVILQPMGPVMFVFDVSDTEPEVGAPPLPPEVERPFEPRRGRIGAELDVTIDNAKRDGVSVLERAAGSQSAGMIRRVGEPERFLDRAGKKRGPIISMRVRLRYELLLNAGHSPEARYATLAHELGHLYCGHLGTPSPTWWPDRPHLSEKQAEFEAESVCWLVCERMGIDNPSAEYIAGYGEKHSDVPDISLAAVLRATGLILEMGRERLPARKPFKT